MTGTPRWPSRNNPWSLESKDINNLGPYFAAANFALTWGLAFYVHIVNKNKATTDRMERLEDDLVMRLNQHSERLTRLEGHINQMPSHNDLGKLYDRLNDQAQSLARMEGLVDQMSGNVRLLLNAKDQGH